MRTLRVARDDHDRRLDRLLRKAFPLVPPGALARAVRTGAVLVNNRRGSNDQRVAEGDTVTVPAWENTGEQRRQPRLAELREDGIHMRSGEVIPILFRDDDCLAVNKPSGIATHGTGALDEVIRQIAATAGWWQESLSFRPGPVHRLDRETSGVQLFALSTEGARQITEEIAARRSCKLYLAVVEGRLARTTQVDLRLSYDRNKQTAVVHRDRTGSSAATVITPLATTGNGRATLVAAVPETGRRHQIRAHCAAIGHPLRGDTRYGGSGTAGFLLHAVALALPAIGRQWNAPLPSGQFQRIRQDFGDGAPIRHRLAEVFQGVCTQAPEAGTIEL